MVSSSRRPDPPGPGGVLRHVLLALLIVMVLTGLGGLIATPGWTGRYHADGVAVGAGLEVVLAALLATVLIRARRAEPGNFVAARLRTALSYLLAVALVVIPLVLLSNVRLRTNRLPKLAPQPATARRVTRSPKPSPPHHVAISAAVIWYSLLTLVLVAAVVACVLLIRHKRRWLSRPVPAAEFGDEPDELRGAVQSGQAALRRVDDTRAAIIACYLAMEQSLASAGTARGIADTPDELLAKAAAAGLVGGGAAAGLTALFYEARFSSHPMGAAERDTAEQALGEIAGDLRRRRPTAAAADSPRSRA